MEATKVKAVAVEKPAKEKKDTKKKPETFGVTIGELLRSKGEKMPHYK